jgi:D-glycero-D-manno-heptose 1,7-bisphosphate phosphatase
MSTPLRPAVFLDRDGTINEDVGYVSAMSQLTLYPFAIDAVRLLNRAGYVVPMVTNQGGIGMGAIEPAFVGELHAEIDRRLAAGGARVDGWYSCPHHPDAVIEAYRGACACRKPATGMAEAAIRDLGIDPARSWMIGDKWIDVQLGHNIGARSILVRTGWGRRMEAARPPGQHVEAIVDDLAAAVAFLLAADHAAPR